jgi:hypothetical protein
MKNLLLLCLLFLSSTLFAQILPAGQCGTNSQAEDIQRLLRNKQFVKDFGIEKNNLTTLIPLKLHLVGRNDGTGRIQELDALEGICKLNEDFAPLDMRFYLYDGFNYIDNSALYDLQYPNVPFTVQILYQQQKVDNAVNIFIGNGLSSGNSGYYTYGQDIIYMDRTYVNDRDGILAHEMGHFFSLIHTFYGWEDTTYDPDSPTPETVIYNGNSYNVEYVDRSINCEESGDFLCGTPADYILNWGGGCNYTGGAVDPDGVLIDPDEANHMAYYSFANCTEYHFSEDQMETIMGDYLSRPDLTIPSAPAEEDITELATLNSPIEGTFIEGFDHVEFKWAPVPNATHYLIQIAPISIFSIIDDYTITTDTSYVSTILRSGRDNYYWRVWAFSEYDFCNFTFSETGLFATGEISTAVEEINNNLVASVFPNPTSDKSFTIEIDLEEASEIHVEITDLHGKMVMPAINQELITGSNRVPVDAHLPSGIYLVQLRGKWGIKVLRIAIS